MSDEKYLFQAAEILKGPRQLETQLTSRIKGAVHPFPSNGSGLARAWEHEQKP